MKGLESYRVSNFIFNYINKNFEIISKYFVLSEIANTLRSCMGLKGMDKILICKDVDLTVINDGASILKI